MTLLTEDGAQFRFHGEEGRAFVYFVRNDSPKLAGVCF